MQGKKVVVITGGSSGIGKATAQLLLSKGMHVYIIDIQEYMPPTENIVFFNCDVRNYEKLKKIMNHIFDTEGQIDYLFANAGIHLHANIEETSTTQFDDMVDINVKGIFHITKLVIPIMKKAKDGSIVLMGSDQSLIAKSNNTLYGMTKAAIAQMAKSLAIDYADHGIRVNCICPGTIDTPFLEKAIKFSSNKYGTTKKEILDSLKSDQPIKRIGKSEEVANAIAFLLSNQSSYITGITLSIDGGFTCQ